MLRKGDDLHDLNALWHPAVLPMLPATLRRGAISVDMVTSGVGREDRVHLQENRDSQLLKKI